MSLFRKPSVAKPEPRLSDAEALLRAMDMLGSQNLVIAGMTAYQLTKAAKEFAVEIQRIYQEGYEAGSGKIGTLMQAYQDELEEF